MFIKVFTTGGTIDKVYFDKLSEFQIGDSQIAEILRPVHPAFTYEVEPVLRKDSLDLNDADRALLRGRIESDSAEKILITHGTDTMRETAISLEGIPGKTIVLTGALAPALFKDSDATFNIGFALACVQTLPAGVYLAMNGCVFSPHHVRKNREKMVFEQA
jgi:L-asparaginase